jgi:hypothetical protein
MTDTPAPPRQLFIAELARIADGFPQFKRRRRRAHQSAQHRVTIRREQQLGPDFMLRRFRAQIEPI